MEETTKTKALRAAQAKRNQSFEPTTPIDQWDGTIYLPVLKLLYFTGCRLAEVSAWRGKTFMRITSVLSGRKNGH